MTDEQWLPIRPTSYEVTRSGRVWNRRTTSQFQSPATPKGGCDLAALAQAGVIEEKEEDDAGA